MDTPVVTALSEAKGQVSTPIRITACFPYSVSKKCAKMAQDNAVLVRHPTHGTSTRASLGTSLRSLVLTGADDGGCCRSDEPRFSQIASRTAR